jgi:hypothetical protein
MIPNVHPLKNRASYYMKQKVIGSKGEIEKPTIVEDFNSTLSEADRKVARI